MNKLMYLSCAVIMTAGCAGTYKAPVSQYKNYSVAHNSNQTAVLSKAKRVLLLEGFQIQSSDDAAGFVSTATKNWRLTPAQAACGTTMGIDYLKDKYSLYLVTSGDLETQKNKVKALGIEPYFKKIIICNSLKEETKRSAFQTIIKENKIKPWQMLSIGNRLSSETREAKKCGALTCHFAFGEHSGEIPIEPEDRPDFTITQHSDLISTCRL